MFHISTYGSKKLFPTEALDVNLTAFCNFDYYKLEAQLGKNGIWKPLGFQNENVQQLLNEYPIRLHICDENLRTFPSNSNLSRRVFLVELCHYQYI